MGNAKDGMPVPEMQDISEMVKKNNIDRDRYCIIIRSDHSIMFKKYILYTGPSTESPCAPIDRQNKLNVGPASASEIDVSSPRTETPVHPCICRAEC